MKSVYKYALEIQDVQTILLPEGATPIKVETQFEAPMVWAFVEDKDAKPSVEWSFRIAGTGHPITDDWTLEQYVGSFLLLGGQLVFHVFARKVSK